MSKEERMVTKHQLEEALKELMPIIEQLHEFEEKHGDILYKYKRDSGIVTEEDRADAAIKILRKYSNL